MIRDQSPLDRLYAYCDAVLSGEIIACKALVLAVERFYRDLERQDSEDFPYVFEEDLVNLYCRMIPKVFRHFEGEWEGKPVEPQPWQIFVIGNVFAWKVKATGKRRFKRAFCTMGRKGGKSITAAIFEIILARLDNEGGAQVYTTATKLDQAKIVHRMVELMVKASPELMKSAVVHKNNIAFPRNSFCRPLGSDRPFDGTNTHAVVLDEVHAWQERHRPFYNTMVSASGTRTQPLEFVISTAGLETGYIYNEELTYARGILDQSITDDQQFVLIFELDEEHDFMDPDFDVDLMLQANPSMGVTVTKEFYEGELNKARQKPSARKIFKLKFANQCDSSIGDAITAEIWDAAKGELSDLKNADRIGAGIDLGGRDDLASYGIDGQFSMGEDEEGRPIYRDEVKSKSFIAEDTKRDLKSEPFSTWIAEGKLIVCQYVISTLKQHLIEDCQKCGIETVAFDPYQAAQLAEDLENEGLKPVKMPQNQAHFNEVTSDYIQQLSEGRFKPDENDDILRWAALNMAVKRDSQDRIMPDKPHSKDKIDPIVAVLMAKRAANVALPRLKGSLVL